MPRRDRRGPKGDGPMTGGRRGLCSGAPEEEWGHSGGRNFGGRKRPQPIHGRRRDGSCLEAIEPAVPREKSAQNKENEDS